jgi:UDP-GlcNAc:undecaprenyl-phosphate GlcNAc-1-phosphate transferase
MSGYLIVLAVATGTTFLLTPLVGVLARRLGAVVQPDERRVHSTPTVTLGGLAMYGGLLAGLLVATRLEQFDQVFAGRSEPLGVLLAATVIFAVGVIDDLREVSAPAKAAGQVLAGSVLGLLGVTMLFFRVPFGEIWSVPRDVAPLITVLWVMGMSNAVNLIDGLDGLAAGIVAIAAGAFFLYTDTLFDQNLLPIGTIAPLIAIITPASASASCPTTSTRPGSSWATAGALLLGLLMACSTLLVGGQTPDAASGSTFFFFAPLFIPFVILGVPILDTAFSIVRRASKRTGPRGGRQGPPAPPAHAPRPRPAALGRHPVGVDGAAVGLRALPGVHRAGERGGALRHRRHLRRALHRAAPTGPQGPGTRRAAAPAGPPTGGPGAGAVAAGALRRHPELTPIPSVRAGGP